MEPTTRSLCRIMTGHLNVVHSVSLMAGQVKYSHFSHSSLLTQVHPPPRVSLPVTHTSVDIHQGTHWHGIYIIIDTLHRVVCVQLPPSHQESVLPSIARAAAPPKAAVPAETGTLSSGTIGELGDALD